MANTNYLDELDGLLDNPEEREHVIDTPHVEHRVPSAPKSDLTANSSALEARDTWANVIENASRSLQDGAKTVQDAAYKNLELAKNQNESIKELVDAASGWRHATRQAVQEVSSAKKNIIILTVISGVIALAGFGTTIGVMLQSRSGLASMSNAVLENVDEHQTLVSRTLTLKMDEMAATIERMEAVLDQMAPAADAAKVQAKTETDTSDQPENISEAETKAESSITTPVVSPSIDTKVVTTVPTSPAVVTINQPATPSIAQINDAVQSATAPLNKQMNDKLAQVTGQLTQLEQNWKQSDNTLQKQLSMIPNAVDEKLAPRLQKMNTVAAAPAMGNTTTVVSQDNKIVLEQLARLRQDMAEIRQLQTSLKEQVSQLKQGQKEPMPYQYRNPETESYPH